MSRRRYAMAALAVLVCVSLAAEERPPQLRYQYRLAGQREWSAPTNHPLLDLGDLKPGTYDVEIRDVGGEGVATRPSVVIRVVVPRPIWQRWWFLLAVALLVAVAIRLYYRRRAARLLEIERVRVRIASDLHDDIGASLSRIAVLSEAVRQRVSDARFSPMLADIADSARAAMESMSDIVWSIDPRSDDVESLDRRLRQCAAEILDAAGITWFFESDAQTESVEVGPAQRRELYLVVKEALTNAVRHGTCRVVTMRTRAAEHILSVTIADDGRGFDPADVERGHGLGSMQSRLNAIGGVVQLSSSPGEGTRVAIALPLTGPSMFMRLARRRSRRMLR